MSTPRAECFSQSVQPVSISTKEPAMKHGPWIALLIVATLLAGENSETKPASKPELKCIQLKHLLVDRAKGKLVLDCSVVATADMKYMLEFFLCAAGGKEYESVLSTPAKPWEIHAGLLLLGLHPGIHAQHEGGRPVPPRGPELTVTLSWTDKDGKAHTCQAGDWLQSKGKPPAAKPPKTWVFVGSEVGPGGAYLADAESGIIAVANVRSAVIDVPFYSTNNIDSRLFVPNWKTIPPRGTKVRMTIAATPQAAKSPYARSLLEIDARGSLLLDGRPVAWTKLAKWAETFAAAHREAKVVIRSAARTPASLALKAQLELKLGGVYRFEFRTTEPATPLLPRTKQQLAETMAEWIAALDRPEEQIRDPKVDAQRTLKRIEAGKKELAERQALWSAYESQLKKAMESDGD
jgi:biopolymer transport protein ExbD